MGLCKCPKRRITNQFCFEHRVNVCEHCMVTNHPKCVVQSYLQWLKDCDYNPICELCNTGLTEGECIRLTCYHVFHWNCVAEYGRSLPLTTGPAGYTCPTCKVGLFPANNLVSPVADVLREKLASVNWARAGLGLPLLIEKDSSATPPPSFQAEAAVPRTHAIVHVDPTPAFQLPRRVVEDFEDVRQPLFDHDENKYKRRTPLDWLLRRWKALWRPVPRGRNFFRRYLARLLLVVFVICIGGVVLSWLGGIVTRDDPSLEIHNNPNIRVAGLQET